MAQTLRNLRDEHPSGDGLDDGVSKNRPVVQWSEPPAHNREGAGSNPARPINLSLPEGDIDVNQPRKPSHIRYL